MNSQKYNEIEKVRDEFYTSNGHMKPREKKNTSEISCQLNAIAHAYWSHVLSIFYSIKNKYLSKLS